MFGSTHGGAHMNSEASGGIPFMITAIQKQGLRDRGYSDDAIRSLTPE
jgi:hypothetical protein